MTASDPVRVEPPAPERIESPTARVAFASPSIARIEGATMLDARGGYAPFVETWTREELAWAATPAVHRHAALPPVEDDGRSMAEYAEWARAR